MKIVDRILENKDAIQSLVNEIDCNDNKWFLYDRVTNRNPVMNGWSTKMSYKVMARNVGNFKSRFIYLKVADDMFLSDPNYRGKLEAKVEDMDLEYVVNVLYESLKLLRR